MSRAAMSRTRQREDRSIHGRLVGDKRYQNTWRGGREEGERRGKRGGEGKGGRREGERGKEGEKKGEERGGRGEEKNIRHQE